MAISISSSWKAPVFALARERRRASSVVHRAIRGHCRSNRRLRGGVRSGRRWERGPGISSPPEVPYWLLASAAAFASSAP